MKRNEILDEVYNYAEKHLGNKIFIPGVSPVPVSGAVLYPEDIVEIVEVATEFWYTDWRKCIAFKRKLCEVTGKKYCVLTNSGSSASLVAQTALLKNSKKKYVITTALGFPTTVYPIFQLGKIPIFIDIDPKTLSPNWDQLSEFDTSDIIANQIFAHTLGFPFDELIPIDRAFIADCCDALGARIRPTDNWDHVGTYSDIMTLSFFPAHHITTGEGGAILTDNEELAKKIERLTNWGRDCYCLPGQSNTCGNRFNHDFPDLPKGWDHKYTFTELGYNLKMTEFQAALGYSQLSHLNDFIELRTRNYGILLGGLYNLGAWEYLDYIHVDETWSQPSPFGFPIIVKRTAPFTAQELIAYLENHKISTRRFFGGNLTRQPFMQDLDYIKLDLSGTDYIMEQGFWIGVWPGLTKEHLDYVIEIFNQFFKEKGLTN